MAAHDFRKLRQDAARTAELRERRDGKAPIPPSLAVICTLLLLFAAWYLLSTVGNMIKYWDYAAPVHILLVFTAFVAIPLTSAVLMLKRNKLGRVLIKWPFLIAVVYQGLLLYLTVFAVKSRDASTGTLIGMGLLFAVMFGGYLAARHFLNRPEVDDYFGTFEVSD